MLNRPREEKSEKRPQVLVKNQTETATPVHQSQTEPVSSWDDFYDRIAKRAYQLYADRGYQHGYDLDDWLKAEREIQEQSRLASCMRIPVAHLEEAGMVQTQTAADLILEEMSRSRECLLDDLAHHCSGLTWNQVFITVDQLCRTGQLLLTRKGPGSYAVRLPDQ